LVAFTPRLEVTHDVTVDGVRVRSDCPARVRLRH